MIAYRAMLDAMDLRPIAHEDRVGRGVGVVLLRGARSKHDIPTRAHLERLHRSHLAAM